MKYLMPYKLFETSLLSSTESYWERYPEAKEHVQTLKDILLDIKDEGCYVSVSPTPIAMAEGIEPDIYVKMELDVSEPFVGEKIYSATDETMTNIYPVFNDAYKRMVSYMDSVGWRHMVPTSTRGYNNRTKVSRYKMDIRFSRK